MGKFWELMRESVITQSLVTLILISTLAYMYVSKIPIPETLSSITFIVLGFWFGAKSQQALMRR